MKANIHPKWHDDTIVTCACGSTFTTGSTVKAIQVEVCSACHPLYTGQMKYLDTAGRVDAFKAKQAGASEKVMTKKQKRDLKKQRKIEKELEKPDTLEELRVMGAKGKKKSKSSPHPANTKSDKKKSKKS